MGLPIQYGRKKFHLTKLNIKCNSTRFGVGSDIYEDPRVRFEYEKAIPPEPVQMETYLVGD